MTMSVRQQHRDLPTGVTAKFWMVDVNYEHPDGRVTRVRKVSPVQTKRGAEEYERQIRQSILDGTYGREEERSKKTGRFAEFADQFVENYAVAHNKPSAVKAKQTILDLHLKPVFGTMPLSQIDVREIDAYKSRKLKEKLQPKTVNTHLAVLGKLLRVAVEWKVLEHAPTIRLLREKKPEFDFLTFEEADQLLAGCDEEPWRTMLLIAMRTGLRPGELRALRWEDVNMKAGVLTVKQSEVNGILGTPKDHEQREVPLSDDALEALKAHRHLRSERVFCHDDGRKLTEPECRAPLRRACRRAGLRQIAWYDLRHTFASHLVMRGVPLKVVQELMGHAAIEMTLRYAHLSPESKREAVKVLGPVRAATGGSGAAAT